MKILIPLAGMGTRLKPFTLTKAKAMVEVAGRPVLAHIMDEILALKRVRVEEVIFITGYLGGQIRDYIEGNDYPFRVRFITQTELKGQAHAVKLAEPYIDSDLVIWFVDTISDADLDNLADVEEDGAIYVKEVADPRRFGQIKEKGGIVTEIAEKADPPISRLVTIGLYYVRDYRKMLSAIDTLIEKDMKKKGEFYLMDAFELMIRGGTRFRTLTIDVWEDCGMPDAFLRTNRYLLAKKGNRKTKPFPGVTVNPPVWIADDVRIENSTIGPNVAIGAGTVIRNAVIEDSIVMEHCDLSDVRLAASMVGEHATVEDTTGTVIVGPYSDLKAADDTAASRPRG